MKNHDDPRNGPEVERVRLRFRFRCALGLVIAGLLVSGVTAFPLLAEMNLLASWFGIDARTDLGELEGMRYWIGHVRQGLEVAYGAYPFLGYGTDLLAYAHLVLAFIFVGPMRRPEEGRWILVSGLAACAGLVPLVLICGAVRGIPPGWQCMDLSFALLGAVPLVYCLRLHRRLVKGP